MFIIIQLSKYEYICIITTTTHFYLFNYVVGVVVSSSSNLL